MVVPDIMEVDQDTVAVDTVVITMTMAAAMEVVEGMDTEVNIRKHQLLNPKPKTLFILPGRGWRRGGGHRRGGFGGGGYGGGFGGQG